MLLFVAIPVFAQQASESNCSAGRWQEVSKDIFVAFDNDPVHSITNRATKNFNEYEMTRCFYQKVGRDEYDLIFYGQSLSATSPIPSAYFLRAMNASAGTGAERHDGSYAFGSKGVLMGVGRVPDSYLVNPMLPLGNWQLNLVAHEFGHAKCCFIGLKKTYSPFNLFTDDAGHWSKFLGRIADGDQGPHSCSLMLARAFLKDANGYFVEDGCPADDLKSFSELSLYLWGFKSFEEIRTKRFPLVSAKGVAETVSRYRAPLEKWVSVEDLASENGELVWPTPDITERHLRAALIFVVVPGTDPSKIVGMIEQFQKFAEAIPAYWAKATNGESTINDYRFLHPRLSVTKDYDKTGESFYQPGEQLTIRLVGGPPRTSGKFFGFDGEYQYSLVITTDERGEAVFSAVPSEQDIKTWSAIVSFGNKVSSNAIVFHVRWY